MKNILVTGSDGYIGSGLYKKLIDSGHKIKAVDRKIFFDLDKVYNDINRPANNFCDIKKEHLDGVDHVIHLAAISNDPLAEIDSRLTDLEINIQALKKFIDYSDDGYQRNIIKKFINIWKGS